MSFKVIETQEQLDAIISERIARAKDATRKEFDGWFSPDEVNVKTSALTDKVSTLESALNSANEELANNKALIAEKDEALRVHELRSVKTRIAHENGLTYEAISFLQGDNEEAIRESAKTLKTLVGSNTIAPMANKEPRGADTTGAAYKELLANLRGE